MSIYISKNAAYALGVAGGLGLGYILGSLYTEKAMRKGLQDAILEAGEELDEEWAKLHAARMEFIGVGEAYANGQDLGPVGEPSYSKKPPIDEAVAAAGRAYVEKLSDLGYSDETPEDLGERLHKWGQDEIAEISPVVIATEEVPNFVSDRDPDNPEIPYAISEELFLEDDDYEKITITYFEKDDTLADDQERTIQDVDGTVGTHNLTRFGEFSHPDKNVVYVRNERVGADFEVCREEGSFSHMVLGLDEEWLEGEPEKPRVLKMRSDD